MDMGKIYLKTAILKRFYPIIIVTFLIFNISISSISQTATASEYQGVGNWVIDDNTTVIGETIVVHGDVIVKDGGSLTLDHCTLKIESVAGRNGIEVEAGGELYVYDTTITSNGESQYYYFDVYGGLEIDGADISKMYFYGLYVKETKDAIIKNSKVHDNPLAECGIRFSNSTGKIFKNNIYKNFRGVQLSGESIVTIINNIITSNYQIGIACYEDSVVNINNNTISETYGDRGRGIDIEDNSIVNISNNIITSNQDLGIFCEDESVVNINNNTISESHGSGGRGINIQGSSVVNISNNIITSNYQVGIACFDDSKVNINNNTISETYGDRGKGIVIEGNSVVNISNNIITSNQDLGIFCGYDSVVNINNNTISESYGDRGRGIHINENSVVNISNNIITSNYQVGIACFDDSKVNINNNTISETYGEVIGRGIEIEDNSTVSIADNIITSNTQVGVFCTEYSNVNINNNIISNTIGGLRGGQGIHVKEHSTAYINNNDIILNEKGIVVLDFANVKIYNSSIINSIVDDIRVENSSHPTIINTQFDFNKLFFNDTESIISVGHWVDVNAQNKNNMPVQNAKITLEDKDGAEVFNGTSDYNGHCLAPVVEYDLDYTFIKKEWTPHTVYASKLGQSASEKITVDRNRVVNFTLDISDKLARGNLITTVVEGHDVTVEYSGNGTVSIEPAAKPAKIPNATKDIGIFININAVGNVEDLYITIRYSDNELGKVNEEHLRMYCYFNPGDFNPGDFNPGDFDFLEPDNFTGGWVKIKNSGVDTYGNVVWAKVSHLTIFAPMAEEIAKPISKGNVWLIYGVASTTSFAILFVAYIILRKRIFSAIKK